MFVQQSNELFLKRPLLMMLLLIIDVGDYLLNLWADAKRAISFLPFEPPIFAHRVMNPLSRPALY